MLAVGDYARANTIGKGTVEGWVTEIRGGMVELRPRGWSGTIKVQMARVHAAAAPQTGRRA